VLAAVIALMIRSLLKPVQSVATMVAQRSPFDGQTLPTQELPTEIVPLVAEINRLLERQAKAVLRERQFVADAAHALRTPLAALQLQVDVLDGSTDPIEHNLRTAELRAGIARCVRLSQQLLSLARIEQASSVPKMVVALDEGLEEIRALYESAASANEVQLQLEANSGASIVADEGSLLLIVGNLLDNALRHSPAGSIVEVSAAASEDWAHVEIRDEGPGLEQDQLECVFERFYRAPGEAGVGSGLGLSTVRIVATQVGGRVELQNRADRSGLIARVFLPRAQSVDSGAPRFRI
jgi:two-component system OmpR family sensor kinase